ncbi:uncharacterized protein LOC124890228, partial [Capsicum annuum]|uniref:uncharacterized protein LOC124890228 n=1 Tax=Capsicum annuum TaxID=4072 RepID=UPI001FB0BED5
MIEEELEEPWFQDIKEYIQTGKYPVHADGNQKRTIRHLSSGFFLSGEILYKRTPDLRLLRSVDAKEASKIMTKVHSEICGPHMSGYVMEKKILRAGYYCLTMERDSINFILKYHECQVHRDLIHSPPSELHTMTAPWPFVAWEMDVIGPIEPKASNGHKFILIIVTNNAANLNSHLMQEVCQQFNIMHRNSTPYCPKANGAVEAANKNLKKIPRKMVQGSRQWHEKLPFALLGYHNTVRTSIGATPYLLVYGNKVVIPPEIEIPSLRVVVEAEIDDDQ